MLDQIDRRGRLAFALAALGGALALTGGTADAAVTPAIQDRTLAITGDAAADKLTLRVPATAPTKLQIDVGDDGAADFSFDRAQFDAVRVLAGAGDDLVRTEVEARGVSLPPTTIDGQAGNDVLVAARGVDALTGGDGFDRVTLTGSAAGEQVRVAADGPGAARLTKDVGAVTARLDTAERIDVAPLGGDDALSVEDLTGTGVQEVRDLGGAGADRLVLDGTPGPDSVDILASGTGSVAIIGLPAFVSVTGADPAQDRLTVRGRDGDDRIAAGSSALPLTADGGAGDDQLIGGAGADTLTAGDGKDFADGGRGDDTVDLGAGDDSFSADAGDGRDTVEGQAGKDTVRLSGSSAAETFEVAAAGPRTRLSRTAADLVDTGAVESLGLFSFGGADRMNLGDLTGTAVTAVDASLFDFGVPGGNTDTVRVDGTAAGDQVRVATATGATRITGLPAAVTLTGVTAANDTLELNALAGADRIDAFDLAAAAIRLRADGGAGDDVLVASAGDDILLGGDGADFAFAGAGDDVAFGGAGDDLLQGEGGDDVLDGASGFDRLAGGPDEDVLLNGEVVTQD